ncbi:protoporphyrinogen oxidase [Metasolibacillus meyeri]|uniref:protoporphyrinogen oxidase n=1 Tax=Metasolibacillus meyeri TaxID=1071052 RepID=UPI000D31FE96|nr:protoporphyrinogen oxidase [Metasolibacillus meyeri]
MKTIVVIGGGITGLSTMHYIERQLQEQNAAAKLILIEGHHELGGKIRSQQIGEFIMETGADSMVARHPGVLDLVREVQFEHELVYNATGISYIHTNNELHAIPTGSTFGIPMNEESLMASTLLTDEEKQRVLQDATIPNDRFTKESSIGEFLQYFLGEGIVRKQIAPVLAGVYSGDLYELSVASTLPYLVDYKNNYGSIMAGFKAHREQFEKAADKKFISFRQGMSDFIHHIEKSLTQVEFKKGVEVSAIVQENGRYTLTLSDGQVIDADIAVLAVPNETVKQLLVNEELTQQFEQFTNGSAITLYVGFNVPDSVLPADGTGFIVSHNSDLLCNASTWTSRKWAHTSNNGNLLVRLFYKDSNPRYEELAAMSDEQLTEIALEDVRLSLNIEDKPTVVNITKWMNKMPRYDLAHRDALIAVEQKMAEHYPNILLAGCSYYGVGIGACIQNGRDTATRIMAKISNNL